MPSVIREYQGEFSGAEGSVEYQIHFTPTSPGCAAQTYGPPENCYPAEGPEWSIDKIEEGVYPPNCNGPEWVDITETHTPEQADHIRSWAEELDLSDEVEEYYRDEAIARDEYHAEQRRDMTGYDD